jgi:uncharacterized metal-binding protein YceD (DUF177 family)
MVRIESRSPDNPDFARVIRVRDLPRRGGFAFEIVPSPEEAAAIARLLGARSLRKMRLAGAITPHGEGFALEARLGASVVQSCIVTLEPVTTRIDTDLHRLFLPEAAPATGEIEIGPDEDDAIEPLAERIDLGLVAIEALALALPAYPRRAGAALPEEGHDPPPAGEDGGSRPLAALAGLRDRLKDRD